MNERKYRYIAENFYGQFDPSNLKDYNPSDNEAQEDFDNMVSMFGEQITECGLKITIENIEDYLKEIKRDNASARLGMGGSMNDDFNIFYDGYIECACWTENISHCTDSEQYQMELDCKAFIDKANGLMDGLCLSQCGHDFWLTRNSHGSGFWDRENIKDEIADKLTELSQSFGEFNIYGDDE